MTLIAPASLRAARAILQWRLEDLVRESGVALSTVHRLEQAIGKPHAATSEKLIATFAAHGVEILPSPAVGARLSKAAP